MTTVVWFTEHDLRVHDHEPLSEAASDSELLPVFVLDPDIYAPAVVARQSHRMQVTFDALAELRASLRARGSDLVCLRGRPDAVLPRIAQPGVVQRVVAHRRLDPPGRALEAELSRRLGPRFELFEGRTLAPPEAVLNRAGAPYRVFTPYWRQFLSTVSPAVPLGAPRRLPRLPGWLDPLGESASALPTLDAFGLSPSNEVITGGETAAHQRLDRFLDTVANAYDRGRDDLDAKGTSRLSADLRTGALSVRQVWHAVHDRVRPDAAREAFLRELGWREFAYAIAWHWPDVLDRPYSPAFEHFEWPDDPIGFDAWRRGETGYPIIDAAARQLVSTGFIANRLRMITASFLTKHLLVHYQRGRDYFFDALVDGDVVVNDCGWQWSAGTGCDAQPYFRVFNPVAQGRRYDPDGTFVRRWVPELARLPNRYVHSPWMAPESVLSAADVRLGRDYSCPIVEHRFARERFLSAVDRRRVWPVPQSASS